MSEKIIPSTEFPSPSLEEVFRTVLEILNANIRDDMLYPSFSSPIEIEEPCTSCGSNFITELFAEGVFACLECGTLLNGQ